jgi:hypothetical protein
MTDADMAARRSEIEAQEREWAEQQLAWAYRWRSGLSMSLAEVGCESEREYLEMVCDCGQH